MLSCLSRLEDHPPPRKGASPSPRRCCWIIGITMSADRISPLFGSSFGPLLRRYREAAGLTQEQLAARAGLSARGISDLERGRRQAPRRDTVSLLATALALAPHRRALLEAAARPMTEFSSGATSQLATPQHNLP